MQVRNARWDSSDKTQIVCEICLDDGPFADQWLPFRATQNDPTEHGRKLFADLVSGEYGAIAEQGVTGQ
jgi:hypothetical protein